MTDSASATSAAAAHRIRDHVCVLANALAAIRLSDGDETTLSGSLQLAERQIDALTRLADDLHDPARPPAPDAEQLVG